MIITLTGAGGTVEVTKAGLVRCSFAGTISLTVSAGRHPLGDGIRQPTIVGVSQGDGAITVSPRGLRSDLRRAAPSSSPALPAPWCTCRMGRRELAQAPMVGSSR